jgi:hypothetical protein
MIGFIFNLGCIQGLHSICWPEGGVGMFSTNIDRIETDGSYAFKIKKRSDIWTVPIGILWPLILKNEGIKYKFPL